MINLTALWRGAAALLVLLIALAIFRACDRREGVRQAELAQARATADSLRKVVHQDSLRSAAAQAAAERTREPLQAATTRADSADARTRVQLDRVRETQAAARRAVADSLSSVVQLAEHVRRLNEDVTRLATAYLAERDARLVERQAATARIAALEKQAAADAAEKVTLYETLAAREREIAAQGKALKCKIGPFPCPSRLTSFLLGGGGVALLVIAL